MENKNKKTGHKKKIYKIIIMKSTLLEFWESTLFTKKFLAPADCGKIDFVREFSERMGIEGFIWCSWHLIFKPANLDCTSNWKF